MLAILLSKKRFIEVLLQINLKIRPNDTKNRKIFASY